MSKPFEQRNRSDTAKRKLKSLAKASEVDVSLVSALANFTWDYDPDPLFPKEATGWVDNSALSAEAHDQLRWIADSLGIPDSRPTRNETEEQLLAKLAESSPTALWSHFLAVGQSQNFGRVSEFASFNYLRGATKSRIKVLDWEDGTTLVIARNLFCKFFRGGSIERCDLAYVWADLMIPIEYIPARAHTSTDWIDTLLDRIQALPDGSGLKDLLGCCKGLVAGSRWFKQEVLQALTYADVIRVNGLDVTEMFIPEHRETLSSHYYSNEWSYPLRFWSKNGGTVNRSALSEFETA